MNALITSCGRFDLLNQTLQSLYKDQNNKFFLTINEDGLTKIGQNKSIEKFIQNAFGKYYFHCECDWLFNNTYDWIDESIRIMEEDPTIIKVICRSDMVHPVEFKNGFGILEPWTDPWKGNEWFGFGWNPGVTRLDLLIQFVPFPKWEQELSAQIQNKGYKVAVLEKGVCKHIGDNRSTHEN